MTDDQLMLALGVAFVVLVVAFVGFLRMSDRASSRSTYTRGSDYGAFLGALIEIVTEFFD